ncbi:MAG: hypothetical protein D6771_04210, partial [Zetaproteobacteria bacterium]
MALLDLISDDEIDTRPIRLGTHHISGQPVRWPFASISHPSMLIVGRSGAGKTHAIKRLAGALADRGLAVHIIDSHGDIEVEDFETVEYGYHTGYGLNPLAIDPHPKFGGPKAAIAQVAKLLQSIHRSMGALQVAMFTYTCERALEKRGVSMRDPKTWQRGNITLDDIVQAIEAQLVSHKMGVEQDAAERMIAIAERIRRMQEAIETKDALPPEDRKRLEDDLARYGEEWKELASRVSTEDFSAVIDRIRSGFSFRGMQSLLIILRDLANSGLFNGKEPNPAKQHVRHLVRGIEPAHLTLLVETLLMRVFSYYARHTTKLNDGVRS